MPFSEADFYSNWLIEYGIKPQEVDDMPATDVYMILYARRAAYIRRKFEQVKANDKGVNVSADKMIQQFGEVKNGQ